MTNQIPIKLAEMSTTSLRDLLASTPAPVVLWPVGSTEPHGPHLPLATDIILSEENADRAAVALRDKGIMAVVAPVLPYGVTDFAAGFTGAISVPADTLVQLIFAVATQFIDDGFSHVCLINHHLEPGQLDALTRARAKIAEARGQRSVSLPLVVSRRWGSQLGAEFRSGACHAGEYEGSLVLAATPELFHEDEARRLTPVDISLSVAIKAGKQTFLEAGADAAYTGRPADASVAEGERLYSVLTEMIVTEVSEHLEGTP